MQRVARYAPVHSLLSALLRAQLCEEVWLGASVEAHKRRHSWARVRPHDRRVCWTGLQMQCAARNVSVRSRRTAMLRHDTTAVWLHRQRRPSEAVLLAGVLPNKANSEPFFFGKRKYFGKNREKTDWAAKQSYPKESDGTGRAMWHWESQALSTLSGYQDMRSTPEPHGTAIN